MHQILYPLCMERQAKDPVYAISGANCDVASFQDGCAHMMLLIVRSIALKEQTTLPQCVCAYHWTAVPEPSRPMGPLDPGQYVFTSPCSVRLVLTVVRCSRDTAHIALVHAAALIHCPPIPGGESFADRAQQLAELGEEIDEEWEEEEDERLKNTPMEDEVGEGGDDGDFARGR